MLIIIYLCMLSFALTFQSIPPILTQIRREFNLTHAQAGLLMSFFALPGIFVAVPGGALSDRLGMKRIGLASLGFMTLGTLVVGTSNSAAQAYVGRIASGVGGLTLAVVLPQLLSKWFIGRELGLGMGVYNTAMPLGTILSLNVFGILCEDFGWQAPIFVTTGASATAFLAFLLFYKEPQGVVADSKGDLAVAGSASWGWSIWFVGICWMWFNAALISFITFSTDFLVNRGYEAGPAGSLSSLIMAGSLLLSPVVGYGVNRFGREDVFIAAGGILLATTIFLVPTTASTAPLFILAGLAASLIPAPTYSLPSRIVRPENLGQAFGVLTACLNIGVLGGPYLVGLTRDLTGDYALGFRLMALFAVLVTTTIGLFSLLTTRRKRRPES
jgi:MFS family permease